MKPLQKFLIEFGPVLVFFVANMKLGPFWATGLFMASVVAALIASWLISRTLSRMLIFTTLVVLVFGGFTIWLHDAYYIQIKVTVVNMLFGAILFLGLAFKKLFLKDVLNMAIELPDEAWRVLTIRWGLFFFATAALNEVLRNTLTFDQWTYFKLIGLMVLTIAFALANAPFMAKYMPDDNKPKSPPL